MPMHENDFRNMVLDATPLEVNASTKLNQDTLCRSTQYIEDTEFIDSMQIHQPRYNIDAVRQGIFDIPILAIESKSMNTYP
jgi:hypothetical protein